MNLFYTPRIQDSAELPEEESRHCITVLRKQEGDIIDLTDGQGQLYTAQITEANPKRCRLQIKRTIIAPRPCPVRIELAVAPTKNADRMEWLAEKATEIGIDTLTFLHTRYSERKTLNIDRIRKILIAAMKQSQKAFLPRLQDMTPFEAFVQQPFAGKKFIAHCRAIPKPLLIHACPSGENVRILIGPEGDFSEEEIALALAHGYRAISLGVTRLRTETAAWAACHTIHLLNQQE